MANENLQKKTLFLRAGDWDFIESVFRPNGVATSLAIRSLVSRWVDENRETQKDLKVETGI
jgi:hypothetical protein